LQRQTSTGLDSGDIKYFCVRLVFALHFIYLSTSKFDLESK